MRPMTVGIQFCGGCNPRIDRGQIALELQKALVDRDFDVVFNSPEADFVIFLSGFAREIHGMIRDYAGDAKERHVKNLVYHIGTARSAYLATILYVEAVAISLFMFVFKAPFQNNLVYLAPILLIDAALLYVAIGYMRVKNTRSFFKLSRNISLGAMALALVVYLIAPLLYIPI